MNPATNKDAGRQARDLLKRHYRGAAIATRRRRYAVAAIIADEIWKRWHVGVYRLRQKHVVWYLTECLSDRGSHCRYQHYLVVKMMVRILGHESWLEHLDGCWSRPPAVSPTSDAQ